MIYILYFKSNIKKDDIKKGKSRRTFKQWAKFSNYREFWTENDFPSRNLNFVEVINSKYDEKAKRGGNTKRM